MNTTTNSTTNPTTTNTTPASTSSRAFRSRSFRSILGAGAIALVVLAGCSTAQRQAMGEQDVRDALASQVRLTVSEHSLRLGDTLVCMANIDTTSALSASCSATTTTGQPVKATFAGSADVNAETCTAALAVVIDGEMAVDQTGVKCFTSV